MSGIFLQNTKRSLLRPLACQGIFATDCYHQVHALLQDLGPQYVALLAEPVHSTGVAGQESIDWYAHVNSSVQPRLLSQLSPEEKAPILHTLQNLARGIHSKAEGLMQSAHAQQALSGEILKLALQYPHEDAIWVVGDQPIVTQWGFAPGTVGAQPEDLARVAAVVPVPPTPPVVTPVVPMAAVAPVAAVPPSTGRGCLAWLLPLLLLLLLLFLLLAALGLLPFALPWPAACLPQAKLPLALEEEQKREHALLSELDALRLQLQEKAALCVPAKPQIPKLQIPKQEAYVEEPLVQEPAVEPPVPATPPSDEPFLGMTPVEEPKKEEPKKEEPKKEEPKKEPPKKQEPKKEPPKKPKKNDPLEIPKDKSDMSFLEGCWVSETGLVNMRTREPVIAEYCFDKTGKGKRLVREKNGTICTGNVKANFTGNGALVMETGDAFCPGGNKYAPQKVDCTGSENSTACTGQELGLGKKVIWDADFRRKN